LTSPRQTKSPLKTPPPRVPGQSLDEAINAQWGKAAIYFFAPLAFGILAFDAWITRWKGNITNPWIATTIFLLSLFYSIYKVRKIRKEVQRLRMARDGEREVGFLLETLRAEGARVLHDVQSAHFNVDHVVVSPHGIFVVETKTYSKPVKGNAVIRVSQGKIDINGYVPKRNPIEQTVALSKWIQDLLQESTGKKFPVQPVVLFPGWYIENSTADPRVWVLNPKALPAFIRNHRVHLSDTDLHLIVYHLTLYVHAHQSNHTS